MPNDSTSESTDWWMKALVSNQKDKNQLLIKEWMLEENS